MLGECGGGRVGVRVREGEREAGQRGGLSPWSGVSPSRFVVLALRQRSGRDWLPFLSSSPLSPFAPPG